MIKKTLSLFPSLKFNINSRKLLLPQLSISIKYLSAISFRYFSGSTNNSHIKYETVSSIARKACSDFTENKSKSIKELIYTLEKLEAVKMGVSSSDDQIQLFLSTVASVLRSQRAKSKDLDALIQKLVALNVHHPQVWAEIRNHLTAFDFKDHVYSGISIYSTLLRNRSYFDLIPNLKMKEPILRKEILGHLPNFKLKHHIQANHVYLKMGLRLPQLSNNLGEILMNNMHRL